MSARKARRSSSAHLDQFSQRRRRYERALRPLGLWESFAAMPRWGQELFCKLKFPDPTLEFDDSFPTDLAGKAFRKALEKQFAENSIQFDDQWCHGRMTARDFLSVLVSLFILVRDNRDQPGAPAPCVRFMDEASTVMGAWFEAALPSVWSALHNAVITPLVARSNLDRKLLSLTLRQEGTSRGKYRIRLIISSTEARSERIVIDGESRPMFRVATSNEWNGVQWLSWESPIPGEPGTGSQYPVYVQSHALRRLRERANLPPLVPYLECWLYESLKTPVVVEQQGENLLIEFRVHDSRIGYLIVTPFDNSGKVRGVAVRTFMFLTMENTPEARMLRKQLRLSRRDVDWLGLSDLNAFTQTDLCSDPVLRPLMESCGCGQLFDIGKQIGESFAPQPRALAGEVRRYLRMAA